MADNHITKRKLKTAANRQYILHVSQQLLLNMVMKNVDERD